MIRRTTSQAQLQSNKYVSLRDQLAGEKKTREIEEIRQIRNFPQQVRDDYYERRFDGAVAGAADWPRCSNYPQQQLANTFDETSILSSERSHQRYLMADPPPSPTKEHPNTYEDFLDFRTQDSKTTTKPTLKRSKSFDDLAILKGKKTKSFSELKKELKASIESIKSRLETVILGSRPKERPILIRRNASVGISSEENIIARSIPRFFRSFSMGRGFRY